MASSNSNISKIKTYQLSTVLLTGASGFLGSAIVKSLKPHYSLTTIGRSDDENISCNLATSVPELNSDFDWVIHAAGKAHVVPKNPAEIADFYNVNFNGTKNLIKGIEQYGKLPQAIVFISTIAVYGIDEGKNIDEAQERNATDPYGKSKIQAEDFLLEWGAKNNVRIGIVRPSLIVGQNPPGNLKALIGGIKSGHYLNIDKGKARLSMVLADDLAAFLPTIAQHGGIYHLTDGRHPSLHDISYLVASHFGKKKLLNIPLSLAKQIAVTADFIQKITGKQLLINSKKLLKITSTLTFDDSKARAIGWKSRSVIENTQLWLD